MRNVCASTTIKRVCSSTTPQRVITCTTKKRVIAIASINQVIAIQADKCVCTTITVKLVIVDRPSQVLNACENIPFSVTVVRTRVLQINLNALTRVHIRNRINPSTTI